ncbi:hypothetical protein Pcinc_041599 [Petrolisthes cinctipes]|uniref:Uncharacterized protein n=1 Tax=Petrolisthes cinctipes TaxID=88211 RepID=A0AAE1BJU8_PETCI|nr:hypothetical protein Pcinc_041599 [Petrolisthes cinctipes]
MVVLEDDDEVAAEEDTRGARTLGNMKKYTLKSAIFNWATAWKDVKTSTLENGWKRLLSGEEPVVDFEGFEATDFMNQLLNAGERVTEETIDNWLESDEGDPGYQILTDEEITASVTATDEQLANEDDEEDEDLIPDIPKLKQVREAIDMLIDYMEHPNTNNEHFRPALPSYLRESREKVIKAQQRSRFKRPTIKSFFRPQTPATPSPHPSTSSEVSAPVAPPLISPADSVASSIDIEIQSDASLTTPSPTPTQAPLADMVTSPPPEEGGGGDGDDMAM